MKINSALHTAAGVFDNVTGRFLKERMELLAFKNVCTTPLFCDRINTEVFLLKDVDSKKVLLFPVLWNNKNNFVFLYKLNIDGRLKEAADIIESGMLVWINESTYLFEKIGYFLQAEVYNNFSGKLESEV